MNFNRFGLTYQDIVNSFRGAIDADFGGQANIENEIDLAEAEIVEKLSPKALQMLQQVEYMEVSAISGSSYTAYPPILQDLYVYEIDRYNPALNNSVLGTVTTPYCDGTINCPNTKRELYNTDLFTDYTLNGDTITFGNTFDQDRNTYYISYTVDTSRLDIPSLAHILRNRVCCILGHQLYSRQDDTWKLVDIYCERGEAGLNKIDEHFLPSEFRKNKYLNNPFTIKGGITTIRVGRG